MRRQTVEDWLSDLASAAPAPGGGAAAAMNAAVGAALISMVCRLTIGKPAYADHEPTMRDVLGRAEAARAEALQLAGADAEAFDAVVAAYRLPRGTAAEAASRDEAIQGALWVAADVPLRTARLAVRIIEAAEEIVEDANPKVVSDVAVAASSAQAALAAAIMNVLVNVASLRAGEARDALAHDADALVAAAARAEAVVADVRERVSW